MNRDRIIDRVATAVECAIVFILALWLITMASGWSG